MALVAGAAERLYQPQHNQSPLHTTSDTPRLPRSHHSYTPTEESVSSPAARPPVHEDTPNVLMSASVAADHAIHNVNIDRSDKTSDDGDKEGAAAITSEQAPTVAFVHDDIRPAKRIKIRDLSHAQSIMRERMTHPASASDAGSEAEHFDISEMPIDNVIEMVAGVLTRITATNDLQHDHLHKQITSPRVSPQVSSVLAFHGKTVPSITILNYLGRIHKYCPTSYEVFVSLLVYFDRITNRVNDGPLQSLEELANYAATSEDDAMVTDTIEIQPATPPLSGESVASSASQISQPATPNIETFDKALDGQKAPPVQTDLAHFFVVDSFNIHRLIIAGVTCASKFFSDIFYTNSRYAKVGGLPSPELNHLELQFLLLNDFRLCVPVEELDAYSTTLVEFYGRECMGAETSDRDVEMT